MFESSVLPQSMTLLAIPVALTFVAVLAFARRSMAKNTPPGPPGSDHSKELEIFRWKKFKEWNDLYGPVASFFVGPQFSIVLGTMEATVDLLEKRSEIYSSRPYLIMGELLFSRLRGFSMEYGNKWRNWRTLQGSMFGPQVAPQIKPMQIHESALMLRDLLVNKDIDQQRSILRRYTASLMFFLAYGRRVSTLNDPLCKAHDSVEEYIESTKVPGKHFLESWPILMWLPKPLQWFRREPEKNRDINTHLYMTAMNETKRKMEEGVAVPCTTTYGFSKQKELGFDDVELAYALSAPWAAGIGTTTAAIEIAILAMMNYPETVRKMQAELDEIVGRDRLPTFEDQQALVYTGGFIKETLRWRQVTPSGIAHSTTEDDTYNGMFIPKGTQVFANAYAITCDPEYFEDPHDFKPERFIDTTDQRLINHRYGSFGFGRRICPGMHVALQSLYIVIARLLWAFDVVPIKVNGVDYIPGKDDFTIGLVARPRNLKYRLVPRFDNVTEIISMDAERAAAEVAIYDG